MLNEGSAHERAVVFESGLRERSMRHDVQIGQDRTAERGRGAAPRVCVIADRDELRSLERAYHELFASSHRAHIGSSFPYVIADTASSRVAAGWRLFAAFDGETLVGCLYGRRTTRTVFGVSLPMFEIGTEFASDPLLRDRSNDHVLPSLIEALQQDQRDCVFFRFSRLSPESFGVVERSLRGTTLPFEWKWSGYGFRVDTSVSKAQLRAGLGKRRRQDIERRQRRLAEAYAVEYECCRDEDADASLAHLEEFVALEDSGWKGRSQTSIRRKRGLESYVRDLVCSATRAGLTRWCTLRLDGRAVAMTMCHQSHDTMWFPKVAYDESLASYSPGVLLTHHLQLQCCDSAEINELNFMSGAPWTQIWNPTRVEYRWVTFFNDSAKARLLYAALRWRNLAQRTLHNNAPTATDRDKPIL